MRQFLTKNVRQNSTVPLVSERIEMLEKCMICPHNCGINRLNGQVGRCKSKETVKVALYSTHNFEEPCISGKKGSGTVFFSNCNMNCVFCQNYEISQQGKGKEISIQELADIKVIIPMLGRTESLNASVAASIIAYEKVRNECYNECTV